jgi:N-carbamoylputrescine amidase
VRVTVCELPADQSRLPEVWDDLAAHCRAERTELLVLPEMPFWRWLAETKDVDPAAWDDAAVAHGEWEDRFGESGAATVLGARPVVIDGVRHNQAFVWEDGSSRPAHLKYYLPDEDGFWEATWYERGPKRFETTTTAAGPVGFLVCSELWFTEHARAFARDDVAVLANPRATEWSTRERWLIGGRAAAVMGGAFWLSSNRGGLDEHGNRWGGLGWVIDPAGEVLATTSEDEPFATVGIDEFEAERAKVTYPRYVAE